MKFAIKSIVAAAAFVAVGAASAAPVTINVGDTYNGVTLASGFGGLDFSKSLVGALNAGKIALTAVAPATANISLNPDGTYKTVGVTNATVSKIVVDSVTKQVTDAYTLGGSLQTAVYDEEGFASTGGSLSVTNIHADLVNKKIFVDIVGANGVGTLNNYYLWDIVGVAAIAPTATKPGVAAIDPITGVTTWGAGTALTQLNGLRITADGFNVFSQALGLTDSGIAALTPVKNFGTVSSSITGVVPEPSTYALMGLGLVGMSLVARRRTK